MKQTAKVVKNYGMRPVGGFGVRGFRAHCERCGFLSRLYENVRGAQGCAKTHRCPVVEEAQAA